MKNISFLILGLISVIGLTALAQIPSPSPMPSAAPIVPAASIGDVILGLLGLVKSWNTLGLYAGIAAALKLLVDGTKALGIFDKIPAAWQSSFVLLVSALTVGLTVLASGATMPMAISAVLGSSAAAMLLHEWIDDLLGWIKAKIEKKTPPAA